MFTGYEAQVAVVCWHGFEKVLLMQLSRLNQWLLRLGQAAVGLCAVPLVGLLVAALTNQLGANPAENWCVKTGEWTLRWLWLTLAISPLRDVASLPALLRYRHTLG